MENNAKTAELREEQLEFVNGGVGGKRKPDQIVYEDTNVIVTLLGTGNLRVYGKTALSFGVFVVGGSMIHTSSGISANEYRDTPNPVTISGLYKIIYVLHGGGQYEFDFNISVE